MRARVTALLISLVVAASLAGVGFYLRENLPPWALGAMVGLPLLGGILTALLIPSPESKREEAPSASPPTSPEPKEPAPKEPAPPPAKPSGPPPEAYLASFLGALQREGRFLDFLQEDLSRYDDAQIGAAVRSIHEKLKVAVFEMVELSPVIEAKEGTEVLVEEGFDPQSIRLIGNVKGKPPFKGLLRHPGWRFRKMRLPKPKKGEVLAPAEVEIP